MKTVIFAVCSLHRHLLNEVANFVMLNEELVAEAVDEVKEYASLLKLEQEKNEKARRDAAKRIAGIFAKHQAGGKE